MIMAYTRPWPMPPRDGTTLYHITDSHVGESDPYGPNWDKQKLASVVRDLDTAFTRHVDGVVHTGDITDDGGGTGYGEPEQDPWALDWLPTLYPNLPRAIIPGNHDLFDRDLNLGGHAPHSRLAWEHAYQRPANTWTDMGDVRIVQFSPDSLDVHTDWIIPPHTLEWMDETIGATTRPVVIADHVALAELGMHPAKPQAGLDDLISAHSNIIGMLCGHQHLQITDPNSVTLLTVGSRSDFPHVCGPSAIFTDTPKPARDTTARVDSQALYVTVLDETTWEVRYRRHLSHRWDGPDGWRVTRIDSAAGTITHTQGST